VHDRLTVTFVDERHLPEAVGCPPDQLPDESNLKGAWLDWFQHRPPRVVPLIHPGTVHEAAAALTPAIEALGPPDVCLLGFGPDGHVASLFPGHPALRAPGPVVAITDSPKPPAERLTLSLPWLQQAYVTIAVGMGAGKGTAVKDALDGTAALPIGMAHPRTRWHIVLDPDAATAAGVPS
jgi:6-phosphogluconolactonase